MKSGFKNNKLVAVFSGTGQQGRSVTRSLLDAGWNVRVVTHNCDSGICNELADLGAEITECDVSRIEQIEGALEGVYGVFLNLDYWSPSIRDDELKIAKRIMALSRVMNVQHLIYSGAPNVEELSDGEISLPCFTMKGKAHEFAKTLNFPSYTEIIPASYFSDWFLFNVPVEDDDGNLCWDIPGNFGKISVYDPESDTGPCVEEILSLPEEYNGRHVILESEQLSPREIIEVIAETLNQKCIINRFSYDGFSELPNKPGSVEIASMFRWFDDFGYFGSCEDSNGCVKWAEQREMKTLAQWMREGRWKPLLGAPQDVVREKLGEAGMGQEQLHRMEKLAQQHKGRLVHERGEGEVEKTGEKLEKAAVGEKGRTSPPGGAGQVEGVTVKTTTPGRERMHAQGRQEVRI